MRRLEAVVVVVVTALMSSYLTTQFGVVSSQEAVPIRNGDVNGDGDRDVSDPIYLLRWMFANGPAPIAIAVAQEPSYQLPSLLTTLLGHLELVEDHTGIQTLRFSGLNIQIVNGMGKTWTRNGAGNLILGYQERHFDPEGAERRREDRSGSHNLVVGTQNDYAGYGGLVAGQGNRIMAPYATITGGQSNEALGSHSHICGGGFDFWDMGNRTLGAWSVVAGGQQNVAVGPQSTISGGQANLASGELSSVSGGQDGHAKGPWSTVSGGLRQKLLKAYEHAGGIGGPE